VSGRKDESLPFGLALELDCKNCRAKNNDNMDRKLLQRTLCDSLLDYGFKEGKSLDSRFRVFIWYGKPLFGRDCSRVEVSVDYYGYTIRYETEIHRKLNKCVSWLKCEDATAAMVFRGFFNDNDIFLKIKVD
jgi:hypothetical protein